MSFSKVTFVFTLLLVFFLASSSEALVLINEILADPPAGLSGDANADGIRHSSQDEFIELFNSGGAAVDVSGWALYDAVLLRHLFPTGSVLAAQHYLVVFGGGSPVLPTVNWQIASTSSLGLNNGGDTVTLLDALDAQVDQVMYGSAGGQNEALVRSSASDSTAAFVLHRTLDEAQGRIFSPGTQVDGALAQRQAHAAPVPELSGMTLALLGGIFLLSQRLSIVTK